MTKPSGTDITCQSEDCVACHCDLRGYTPSVCFLAGMAFVAQFNTGAVKRRLCAYHSEAFATGYAGALPAVPPGEGRGN